MLQQQQQKHLTEEMTADEVAAKFKKMTQREHIYALPDSYVGSADETTSQQFLLDSQSGKIRLSDVKFVPALYKIMDELLVNSWDQKVRTDQLTTQGADVNRVTQIDVSVDPTTTELVVCNNGDGINIAMHPVHKVYTVELIFGHLLTSTNYHAGEKLTGGKNGYGAKLANVFSHRFEVETVDRFTRQRYTQVFENNMQVINPPHIEPYAGEPYTRIRMLPDLQRFGMTHWTTDMLRIVQRRAIDMAACGGARLTVTFNGTAVPCKSFADFMHMFPEAENGMYSEVMNERWEVGIAMSDGYKHASFVNGVSTIRGGKHVDYITNQVAKRICDLIEKKQKIKVKTSHVRDNIMVFVNCLIVNPSFDGQTKETLTTPISKFGSKCELNDSFVDVLVKLGIVDRVMELHQFKENMKDNQKISKRVRLSGIPKLDDANFAGGSQSHECTLILTEGDSAKTTAISGLSVVGRDKFGIFPLRGKMINAREKLQTPKGREQLFNNEEVKNVKRILGLEVGKKYTAETIKSLRYGKVMIMTDQDVDGSHIKGLFMNWLDAQWPELLQLGFITAMLTPIIKVKKGSTEIPFYSIGKYLEWQATPEASVGSWSTKYYKGLGTSTTQEAKEYFRALMQVHYKVDASSMDMMDMAFAKDRPDDRKKWLTTYNIGDVVNSTDTEVTYSDFINKELKHFSIYDLQRSIGHVCDGLKPSQRKILYACFKRKLHKEIKVAQLAGYVSEHTGYHHGEDSLNGAIVSMAQTFVGANNMNLLVPVGQFGTRLQGGKDSASPRYIFTLINYLTSMLFPEADMPLLEYLDDDGMTVEPRCYKPILPVALLNGVNGIGTGWSTMVPMFNPLDVYAAVVERIKTGQITTPLHPYYTGFSGQIIKISDKSYLTKGKYEIRDHRTVIVHELPIGTWTDDYKLFLETLLVDYTPPKGTRKTGTQTLGVLKHYTSHCTESTVMFELEFCNADILKGWSQKPIPDKTIDYFEKSLKLTSKISLTNMHLFNTNNVIQKYGSANEIIEDFFGTRYAAYEARKEYQLSKLKIEIDVLAHKIKFIDGIVQDTICIAKKTKAELVEMLETMVFPKFATAAGGTASYNYLLQMPLYSLTTDTLADLKAQQAQKLEALAQLTDHTIDNMWLEDLEAFHQKYTTQLEKDAVDEKKQSKLNSVKKRKRASSKKTGTKNTVTQ
jgi:DNA topoisomerase-2